jgi:hypothetical protein
LSSELTFYFTDSHKRWSSIIADAVVVEALRGYTGFDEGWSVDGDKKCSKYSEGAVVRVYL